MSIPVSTVPQAITAIFAAIVTQVGATPTVLVCVGDPSKNAPPGIISVGTNVRRQVKPHAQVGSGAAGFLEEAYTVAVSVSMEAETTDVTTTVVSLIDKTWQLVAKVEAAVRTDPSLGGVVLIAYPSSTSGGRPTWAPNNVGRISTLTVLIHCEAVI